MRKLVLVALLGTSVGAFAVGPVADDPTTYTGKSFEAVLVNNALVPEDGAPLTFVVSSPLSSAAPRESLCFLFATGKARGGRVDFREARLSCLINGQHHATDIRSRVFGQDQVAGLPGRNLGSTVALAHPLRAKVQVDTR